MYFVDHTGEKHGKLTILKRLGRNEKRKRYEWLCKCDCGNECVRIFDDIRNGNSLSCGCGSSRNNIQNVNKSHEMSKTRFYKIWCGMIKRCTNPNSKSFKDYGEKGITVCEEWKSFENFKNDMFETYNDNLTIERRDNSLGYSKENCEWIPKALQSRNRSGVTLYDYKGEKMTIPEIAKKIGIKKSTLRNRLDHGWDFETATTTPIKKEGKINGSYCNYN